VQHSTGSDTATLKCGCLDWGEFAEKFAITWSHGGNVKSFRDLADHLRLTMQEKRKTRADIPTEPRTSLPKQRQTLIISAVRAEMRELDKKYFSNVSKFRKDIYKVMQELYDNGEGSLYSLVQPPLKPAVKDLVREKERIDIVCGIVIELGSNKMKVLRWCQGKVEERER